jgi:hypothetical protein
LGIVLLLLGSGGQALFLASAFNLVAASALGAWALVLFLAAAERHSWWVATLLLLSIVSSGVGLFYIAAVGVVSVIRRRQVWVVLPASGAYVIWLFTFGRGPDIVGSAQDSGVNVALVASYAVTGLGHVAASVGGLPQLAGLAILLGTAFATASVLIVRRTVIEGSVAGLTGLLAQFALTGLARAQFGINQANESRYVYIGAVFLFVAIGSLVAWARVDWQRARWNIAVVALASWLLVPNVVNLRYWQGFLLQRADETNAVVSILLRYGGSPAIPDNLDRAVPLPAWEANIPGPAQLRTILSKYGWPATGSVPPDTYQRMLFAVSQPGLVVSNDASPPSRLEPVEPVSTGGVKIGIAAGCLNLEAVNPDPYVEFDAPAGARLVAMADPPGQSRLLIALGGPFTPSAGIPVPLGLRPTSITLPDLDTDELWAARLQLPVGSTVQLCTEH